MAYRLRTVGRMPSRVSSCFQPYLILRACFSLMVSPWLRYHQPLMASMIGNKAVSFVSLILHPASQPSIDLALVPGKTSPGIVTETLWFMAELWKVRDSRYNPSVQTGYSDISPLAGSHGKDWSTEERLPGFFVSMSSMEQTNVLTDALMDTVIHSMFLALYLPVLMPSG